MTSTPLPVPRRRRSAADRRAEIVETATRLALVDGLDQLTLRSVAESLGVVSSLVSHYFPSVDDLLAEAFAAGAGGELAEVHRLLDEVPDPLERVRRLLELAVAEERDRISTLWIDAWHIGRRRPALLEEIKLQSRAWIDLIAELVTSGVAAGVFASARPHVSAMRVLSAIDGLSIQAVMRETIDYDSVKEVVRVVAEHELGLPPGTLA